VIRKFYAYGIMNIRLEVTWHPVLYSHCTSTLCGTI